VIENMPETEVVIVPKGLLTALHAYLSQSRLPFVEVNQFLKAIEASRLASVEQPEREHVDA
jgi:hypothetical protein